MIADSWVKEAVGPDRAEQAMEEANRRRLRQVWGLPPQAAMDDRELREIARALELRVFDLLAEEAERDVLRRAASDAYQVGRVLRPPPEPIAECEWWVRLGCLAVLADRGAEGCGDLHGIDLNPVESAADWGERVWASILEIWLRLLRKRGWEDFDAVQERVAALRGEQRREEPPFLSKAEKAKDVAPAWRLIAEYHLAKAAELLGRYLSQGDSDGRFDVRQQLESHFDRALGAAERGQLLELDSLIRLLARTADKLVANSIWTVTRAVNSRVTRFVNSLVARGQARPIFEMLPPQRKTLREEGLLGSSFRSVVVSLPTSSGKTLIAQFRILQALNQFDEEAGWVAYLAPTRALVNQLTNSLRRDFALIGIPVEKVTPALEIDGLEMSLLTERSPEFRFRLLVTTPEKLDLMLRGGWEEKIGRPLTLVVVDEAHGLASADRGLKLELLLATINRECRHAQFLLLTPFIRNADEIARWLAPESHQDIELGLDWSPNDRAVVLGRPVQGERRGDAHLVLETLHASQSTLVVPEALELSENRPLGLTWSKLQAQGNLAAATAQSLRDQGRTVILLAGKVNHTWGIAERFRTERNRSPGPSEDIRHVQTFLADEMGEDLPLADLLEYGVGVHHAGLPDDVRSLVEWLIEEGTLQVLVATTTVAQGVNFPIGAVVLASHQYPYGQDMPPAEFWNLAGRVGRIGQEDLGIVALAAGTDEKAAKLKEFVCRQVGELGSTLIEMVQSAVAEGKLLNLESLSWQPAWSSFLQYLAHTYRLIGQERFAAEVEQVLRGTLGFEALRKSHRGWAENLVRGVRAYGQRLHNAPLKLVDSTGFSVETVRATLGRLRDARIGPDMWSPDLFDRGTDLRRLMGILLDVPELRTQLEEVTGGPQPGGDALARIIADWVKGMPLPDLAREHFSQKGKVSDPTKAMTECCRNIFGRLTQTASWGLSALQSLTLSDEFERLSDEEQQRLRNLPAKVYYGVSQDEAVALRLLGVPRTAAAPLSVELRVKTNEPLSSLRERLRQLDISDWTRALGASGTSYRRVWHILEGGS